MQPAQDGRLLLPEGDQAIDRLKKLVNRGVHYWGWFEKTNGAPGEYVLATDDWLDEQIFEAKVEASSSGPPSGAMVSRHAHQNSTRDCFWQI